jgi:hypothetical protein
MVEIYPFTIDLGDRNLSAASHSSGCFEQCFTFDEPLAEKIGYPH